MVLYRVCLAVVFCGAALWINEVGVTCKMNIEMALKSRSYILDLYHVKLSLWLVFFPSCFIETFFPQLSGSTFILVKNTHQKAANLMFCLISPVAKTPACFLEGQFSLCNIVYFTPGRALSHRLGGKGSHIDTPI